MKHPAQLELEYLNARRAAFKAGKMDRREYSMITIDEEHSFQFSSKHRAIQCARLETIHTGRKHQHILTVTYRDCIPRVCWYVCLSLVWRNGNLVTA